MKVSQKLYNEKQRSVSETILMNIGILAVILLGLYLVGLTGSRKGFHGTTAEWCFFGVIALYFFGVAAFEKTLEWISFDYQWEFVEINTSTLFTKEKKQQIALRDVRYKTGKEGKRPQVLYRLV